MNDIVTDWIRDLCMPSIDEECGSVISDEISNEEMLHHLNFHSTTIRKKEVKPWVFVGSADSGVGSENSKDTFQNNRLTSYCTLLMKKDRYHQTLKQHHGMKVMARETPDPAV